MIPSAKDGCGTPLTGDAGEAPGINLSAGPQLTAVFSQHEPLRPVVSMSALDAADEDSSIIAMRSYRFLRFSLIREMLFISLSFLTGGIYAVILSWFPRIYAFIRFAPCQESDTRACVVLVQSLNRDYSVNPIFVFRHGNWFPIHQLFRALTPRAGERRMFLYRYERFYEIKGVWSKRNVQKSIPFPEIHGAARMRAFANSIPSVASETNSLASALQLSGDTVFDKLTKLRLALDGENVLDVEEKSLPLIFAEEMLKPFFWFQIFSICVWFFQQYTTYAWVVVCMTLASLVSNSYTQWIQMKNLAKLAKHEGSVQRARIDESGCFQFDTVLSKELCVGDVVRLHPGMILPCDMILLSSQCIVSESMLTGESAPVSKTSLPASLAEAHNVFRMNRDGDSKYILFSGTKLISARRLPKPDTGFPSIWDAADNVTPPLAIVLRTGFATAKGKLLRAILFPKPSRVNYKGQIYKMLSILFLTMIAGCAATIAFGIKLGSSIQEILYDCLNVMTIAVPPALPLALNIALISTFDRLKKKKILCSNPERINAAGAINCICYDKTGTLTTDGLTLNHVLLNDLEESKSLDAPFRTFSNPDDLSQTSGLDHAKTFAHLIASCHSISMLEGVLVGDPLEVEMFYRSKWDLLYADSKEIPFSHENWNDQNIWKHPSLKKIPEVIVAPPSRPHLKHCIAVLKKYDFDADLRRMSVLVSELPLSPDGETRSLLFTKGAPESLQKLCKVETIPSHFESILHKLTRQGFRVLACAYKLLGEEYDLARDSMEKDLIFLGFIVMENKLKEPTKKHLIRFASASKRQIMVTGDNPLTATAVGLECGPIFFSPGRPIVIVETVQDGQELAFRDMSSGKIYALSDFDDSLNADFVVTGPAFTWLQNKYSVAESSTASGRKSMLHKLSKWAVRRSAIPSLQANVFESLLLKAGVFARMTPQNKRDLISSLQALSYGVAMVGDGANDSAALKTADVGVSISAGSNTVTKDGAQAPEISEAEKVLQAAPSIAAPFSTQLTDIGAAEIVLVEGRAAMINSFSIFKFMFLYGLVQLTSVLFLSELGYALADNQYLWSDLGQVLPFVIVIPSLAASGSITRGKPDNNLLSYNNLISIFGLTGLMVLFQGIVIEWVNASEWTNSLLEQAIKIYAETCQESPDDCKEFDGQISPDTTAVWLYSNFVYIFLGMALSQNFNGYRQPIYRNPLLGGLVVIQLVINAVFLLVPYSGFLDSFAIMDLPSFFRWELFFYAIGTGIAFLIFERIFVRHESDDEDPIAPLSLRSRMRSADKIDYSKSIDFGMENMAGKWSIDKLAIRYPIRAPFPFYAVYAPSAQALLSTLREATP